MYGLNPGPPPHGNTREAREARALIPAMYPCPLCANLGCLGFQTPAGLKQHMRHTLMHETAVHACAVNIGFEKGEIAAGNKKLAAATKVRDTKAVELEVHAKAVSVLAEKLRIAERELADSAAALAAQNKQLETDMAKLDARAKAVAAEELKLKQYS